MSQQRARAQRAYQMIREIATKANTDMATAKKLKTRCMKTPSLIQQSGAAQAVAFLRSREGEIGRDFSKKLAHVLELKDDVALHTEAFREDHDVVSYMYFTHQLADAAAWLRRFAQSDLTDIEEEMNDDN